MKRILLLLGAAALLAGCMTVSSAYDGATPSRTVENTDGSTTFEFLFPANVFDENMATQRINEYLTLYTRENALSSYDILSTSYSQTDVQEIQKTRYTRVLAQVEFTTLHVDGDIARARP
jgi:uncharacterized lipoprotein YajG